MQRAEEVKVLQTFCSAERKRVRGLLYRRVAGSKSVKSLTGHRAAATISITRLLAAVDVVEIHLAGDKVSTGEELSGTSK